MTSYKILVDANRLGATMLWLNRGIKLRRGILVEPLTNNRILLVSFIGMWLYTCSYRDTIVDLEKGVVGLSGLRLLPAGSDLIWQTVYAACSACAWLCTVTPAWRCVWSGIACYAWWCIVVWGWSPCTNELCAGESNNC